MKNLKYIFLFICIAAVWGCKPEKFGPITTSADVVKQMQGSWALTSVVQVDEAALTKGFPYKQLDITNVYAYKDLVISFQGDAQGNPGSFTITPGNSPKISDVTSGTWSVDDPKAPLVVTLKNGTVQSQLLFSSYVGLSGGKLSLKRTKSLNGKPLLSYQYTFTKK